MVSTKRAPGALSLTGLVGVTLLTFVAVWASVAAGRWSPTFSRGSMDPAPTVTPTELPEVTETLPPDYGLSLRGIVVGILVAMGILAILGSLGYSLKAVRTVWQSRTRKLEDDDDARTSGLALDPDSVMPDVVELREGIAEAWRRLAEHRDPTDAVQAAWVAVEDAAGRSGFPREPSATPTEFTVAVLDRTAVDPAAIRTLLGLYHRARYSTHGATDDDVELAGQCLTTLGEGLGA